MEKESLNLEKEIVSAYNKLFFRDINNPLLQLANVAGNAFYQFPLFDKKFTQGQKNDQLKAYLGALEAQLSTYH